jgi:O-antigen biosynthesis protein
LSTNKHIIIIGLVWPEPESSAAGLRMLQLIRLFRSWNWRITFCSAANESPYQVPLNKLVDHVMPIHLNDSSFDTWMMEQQPDFVLFDRYITEEQFGWRVAESCPTAIRILDTEDLHCLRYARGEALKKGHPFLESALLTSDPAKREIASIYRSDITLMVSSFEMELLQRVFGLPVSLIHYLPLFYDRTEITQPTPSFQERNHAIFIGNFLHQPNLDAAQWLCTELWPEVKQKLPFAELHIYGAYMPKRIEQLNSIKKGIHVKGRAKDALATMKNYRINLAPLRFGAGIKGKLLDALLSGTPSITTSIGSEGMGNQAYWQPLIAEDKQVFTTIFELLYTTNDFWDKTVKDGKDLLLEHFEKSLITPQFYNRLDELQKKITIHRQENFVGAMLQHHTIQSTRYFSKWIELKSEKTVDLKK